MLVDLFSAARQHRFALIDSTLGRLLGRSPTSINDGRSPTSIDDTIRSALAA